MTDLSQTNWTKLRALKVDKAWAAIILIMLTTATFAPTAVAPVAGFAASAFASTSIFILFAVIAVGFLKASGAESTIAGAFVGRESRMIVLAAILGGLSPFCSCEVIPFIAALLVAGAPPSAVMAFWLASPLMDPAMFLITSGSLGFDFAVAKAIAAISLGLFGGFGVKALAFSGVFREPLRADPMGNGVAAGGGCGCGPDKFSGKPVWAFWHDKARRETFRKAAMSNALFLGKWLLLAYILEALMIRYIPSTWIAGALGGSGVQPIVLGALLGGPAYLNGYAAVPLVAGMLDQGMSQGAAMSFVLAGGVSCIPAAIAVWALVKPRVFFSYLGFAFAGSTIAGFIWSAVQ